uniref:RING-type E3 ubiquitin transferase n=1 Tax=Araucaria cunninghamii TaxID=56994 RepID=A0A0D6QYF7_ARACU
MGNSLGCSASGERLVSAARDGDLLEARMLLDFNPCLARYSTFGGLNSPLHFAASKGHAEIVTLLLEHGADVNSRNYCGQTALMQACRYGHWEVVQTLLLFKGNVTRADYLSGRTALHFAAVNGHTRCVRLVVADFVPSVPYNMRMSSASGNKDDGRSQFDLNGLTKFVNRAADGGITALHMAALNGHFDCVQLLLDLNANVSTVTFHYGTSMDLIGAGSTALHYAACGGNIQCCQILLARGASRTTLNCNGWIPLEVARIWGRHWLEPLLSPNSELALPSYAPSSFLSLPLMSILNIAREFGLEPRDFASDDSEPCAVCLERSCTVAAEGCGHELCTRCALYICSTNNASSSAMDPPGSISCPFCRQGIVSFVKLPGSPSKELKLSIALGLCAPCAADICDSDSSSSPVCKSEFHKNRVSPVSSESFCSVSCSPFPSVSLPLCSCNNEPGSSLEARQETDSSQQAQPPVHDTRAADSVSSENGSDSSLEQKEAVSPRVQKASCSKILFWSRKNSNREKPGEQPCNSEISV